MKSLQIYERSVKQEKENLLQGKKHSSYKALNLFFNVRASLKLNDYLEKKEDFGLQIIIKSSCAENIVLLFGICRKSEYISRIFGFDNHLTFKSLTDIMIKNSVYMYMDFFKLLPIIQMEIL